MATRALEERDARADVTVDAASRARGIKHGQNYAAQYCHEHCNYDHACANCMRVLLVVHPPGKGVRRGRRGAVC